MVSDPLWNYYFVRDLEMAKEFVYLVGCFAFFLTNDVFVCKKLIKHFCSVVVVQNE